MKKVIVIGGGAAGMISAVFAARKGADVSIYEKNDKLGKKLYITGKGRCNLTNACDMDELFHNVISNSNFLYSAFYGFTNNDAISFFEGIGLKTKIERGDRVFPISDHSSDVIRALSNELQLNHVKICLSSKVDKVLFDENIFKGILLSNGRKVIADACIIASGGLSYPSTGSTGDGYRFAIEAGHTITDLSPSLTSIKVDDYYIKELEGLTLKNVKLNVLISEKNNNISNDLLSNNHVKSIYENFGEMVFTHDGVSGPLILSASRHIIPHIQGKSIKLIIDLKPALTEEILNQRILRDFNDVKNKQFKNYLNQLLPQKLIHVIIEKCGIDKDKQINSITKEERIRLIRNIKNFTLDFKELGGYNEAVITKGGIHVKEVNPSTMESKLINGLYYAGEILDLDALTGGFNLQIAWSTGYLAGCNAASESEF